MVANWLPDPFQGSGGKFANRVVSMCGAQGRGEGGGEQTRFLMAADTIICSTGTVFRYTGTFVCCTGTVFWCTGTILCCAGIIFCCTGTIFCCTGTLSCYTGTILGYRALSWLAWAALS